jgi:N-acetyl-anhydromuramyl-L-alanine amidase AmpD
MKIPGVPFVQGRNAYSDRDSRKYGIAIHNTSNDATAEQEASYATRRTDGISAHFYVDADSVVQSLDTDARAGHAGSGEGNEHAIAVEITGVNGWTRQQWLDRVAWDELARVLAGLCRHHGIEPRRASVAEMTADPRVRAFYSHDDMRRAWGGTTHTDPGPNFPWDHLFAVVEQAMAGETEEDEMTEEQIIAAVRVGVHGLFKEAAAESTATGRQVRDYLRAVIGPAVDVQALDGEELTAVLAGPAGQVLAERVLAGLDPRIIAAAIPQAIAGQVADELARRMQG